MHPADGDDDIAGINAMSISNRPPQARIARGRPLGEREIAELAQFDQLVEAEIGTEAFGKIVTRRRSDQ
jgi:hypothetical protein